MHELGAKSRRQTALEDVGAGRRTGDRWLELGAVPVERRERILAACEGERLSVSYFLKQARTDGLYSSDRGDWATPQRLFDLLNAEFDFLSASADTEASRKDSTKDHCAPART